MRQAEKDSAAEAALKQKQEEAEMAMMGDAFGGGIIDGDVSDKKTQLAGDKVVLVDIKDHMKHARKVADSMKVSSKVGRYILMCKSI